MVRKKEKRKITTTTTKEKNKIRRKKKRVDLLLKLQPHFLAWGPWNRSYLSTPVGMRM